MKTILFLLAAISVSCAHPVALVPSLTSARLAEAARNWPHGNVKIAKVHFNGRIVDAVLLYQGKALRGYIAFRPGQTKPFAILPTEQPILAK